MVLNTISYFQLLGKPLIMWLGIMTILLLLTTAYLGYKVFKGRGELFMYHKRLAIATILLALVHGTLGVLAFF
ncbi:hypothetical protein KY337_04510 [Candidatus Woesearchaeota archaeon]|nr:hypothetical protein [Candidatus Woesearchaeota archaeon]